MMIRPDLALSPAALPPLGPSPLSLRLLAKARSSLPTVSSRTRNAQRFLGLRRAL